MQRRILILTLFFILCPVLLQAQNSPVAGRTFTLVYHPAQDSPLAEATSLSVFYVFDYWNKRFGTRLALWQNVVHADTSRLHVLPLMKNQEEWTAEIPIPTDAALLSYIVSDGSSVDGNNQRTYVSYILNEQGEPVRNARYLSIPFLKLAREEIGVLIREAEREIVSYPENFTAYHQYFTLLLEQAKGNPRTQQRIAGRLDELEKLYPNDSDFLNMAAETWFYILQDAEKAMEYRNRISPSNMWPQVFRMFNREEKRDEDLQRIAYNEGRRRELLGSAFPAFNLLDRGKTKTAIPRVSGKAAIYVFWASVSEKSCNLLLALRAALSDQPGDAFDIIAVNLDLESEKGAAWFDEQRLPFALMYNQGNTLIQLGVDNIPITYFVDEDNTIRDILIGYSEEKREALRSALAKITP